MGDEERSLRAMESANNSTRFSASLLESAFQDIFRASSSSSLPFGLSGSEVLGAEAGPMSVQQIREHTLCFMVEPEQKASHNACPVCMQDFEGEEWATTLRCFHIFHT
ncbi:unnamed protein product, partial [Polarella glacialis]